MLVQDYLQNMTVRISKENYTVVKASRPHPRAVAAITDLDAVTSIIDQNAYDETSAFEAIPNWKICTITNSRPSAAEPVQAVVVSLRDRNISCLGFVAAARFHLLIRSEDIGAAVSWLEQIGWQTETV